MLINPFDLSQDAMGFCFAASFILFFGSRFLVLASSIWKSGSKSKDEQEFKILGIELFFVRFAFLRFLPVDLCFESKIFSSMNGLPLNMITSSGSLVMKLRVESIRSRVRLRVAKRPRSDS